MSSLLFNIALQMALKDDVTRWQNIKGMGICFGDSESDCLTNLRFADDVPLFSTSLVQLPKMMCDFKKITVRVGLKIHPDSTRILSNQSSNRRREVEINNMHVETFSACKSAEYLGQAITFVSATGNSRDQQSNQSRLGRYKHELTSRSYFLQHTLLVQHGDHADAELRLWHLGHYQGNTKE